LSQKARFVVDLHNHSTFSDGDLTPTALVRLAARRGVTHLALTDHDTTAGLDEAHAAGQALGVTIIDGVELSAWSRRELHVLGYHVDRHHAPLKARLEAQRTGRIERVHTIGERLAALGKPIDVDAVMASAHGNVGRPHIARALVKAGWVRTMNEAFQRFLGDGQPAYVPAARMGVAEAIELIHDAGGVAVLAHPGVGDVDAQVPEFVDAGLDGLECHHPAHDTAKTHHYVTMARLLGLCETGGSDFHSPKHSAGPGTHGIDLTRLAAVQQR
jgi:predicted metal-dependent phosphoesterase TrpH